MRSSVGGVLIEFAIGLPVILILLAYSIELGNAISNKQNIEAIARDVARVAAAIDSTDPNYCNMITAEANARASQGLQIDVNPCPPLVVAGGHSQGCDLEVTINLEVADPASLWGYLNIFDFNLNASATSRYDNGVLCTLAP